MREKGITPDTVTYTAAISACERKSNSTTTLALLDLMKVRDSEWTHMVLWWEGRKRPLNLVIQNNGVVVGGEEETAAAAAARDEKRRGMGWGLVLQVLLGSDRLHPPCGPCRRTAWSRTSGRTVPPSRPSATPGSSTRLSSSGRCVGHSRPDPVGHVNLICFLSIRWIGGPSQCRMREERERRALMIRMLCTSLGLAGDEGERHQDDAGGVQLHAGRLREGRRPATRTRTPAGAWSSLP